MRSVSVGQQGVSMTATHSVGSCGGFDLHLHFLDEPQSRPCDARRVGVAKVTVGQPPAAAYLSSAVALARCAEFGSVHLRQVVASGSVVLTHTQNVAVCLAADLEIFVLGVELDALADIEAERDDVRVVLAGQVVNLVQSQPMFSRDIAEARLVVAPRRVEVNFAGVEAPLDEQPPVVVTEGVERRVDDDRDEGVAVTRRVGDGWTMEKGRCCLKYPLYRCICKEKILDSASPFKDCLAMSGPENILSWTAHTSKTSDYKARTYLSSTRAARACRSPPR